ncbi:NAD(P)/FAD-dependent oxidoreductase [Streptomyces sp. NBRC 110028]|uniref:NAD(P)/FAD-dependent oxidoreductase n=1 Tax=Streptomyces sp. NBRC 110028 TaxID=1621260 RepID=UPI0006E44B9A|nr:FAD-dependent oxidoreductase [Streptomyces sp. NBRC 110028]
MSAVVVVGNGIAAHRLVDRLHHHGHRGTVTVLGAEPVAAYNRVLLPSVLDGTLPARALALPGPPDGTVVRLGTRVTGIDRERRLAHASDGTSHPYDHLVLATGARPRIPAVPGLLTEAGRLADGVTPLRTVADCRRVTGGQVAVVGAGVLGVETALALRRGGTRVTLVHPRPYPMNRQLDATAGAILARCLRDHGIRLEPSRQAVAYAPGTLTLDRGQTIGTDSVVVCAGVRPDIRIARAAGLAVGTGVVVDDTLTTDDPHIHAIGDCAEEHGTVPGLATTAWDQAERLAARLCGGRARPRASVPVTRLKAPGLDIAAFGPPGPAADVEETVTLQDPARGRYARLELRDQRLLGAVLVGYPQAIASLSTLGDQGLPVPTDRLAFLLGTPAERHGPVEVPDDAVLCHCNNVTKRALADSWRGGARDAAALAAATHATTGCGSCAGAVRDLCAALHAAEPRPEPAVAEAVR